MKTTTAYKSVSIVVACFLLLVFVRFTTNRQPVFDQIVPTNRTAEFNKIVTAINGSSRLAGCRSAETTGAMNSRIVSADLNATQFLHRNLVMKSNNYLYNCMGSEIKWCEKKLTFQATLLKKDCQYIELELYKL
jgi:hypothetical protein